MERVGVVLDIGWRWGVLLMLWVFLFLLHDCCARKGEVDVAAATPRFLHPRV